MSAVVGQFVPKPGAVGLSMFELHGGDLALELAKMVEFGLPAMLSLVAATSNAARLLRMDDQIGSIEQGKQADLLLVAGDPLADIGVMQRPTFVMKGGRVVRDDVSSVVAMGS